MTKYKIIKNVNLPVRDVTASMFFMSRQVAEDKNKNLTVFNTLNGSIIVEVGDKMYMISTNDVAEAVFKIHTRKRD